MAINCYARRRVPGVAADPSRSRRVERAPRCGVLATGDASRVLRRRGCGTSASAASDTSPFVAPAVRARVRRAIGRVSPSDCKRSSDCCGYRDASAEGIAPRARRVRGAWRGSASASVSIGKPPGRTGSLSTTGSAGRSDSRSAAEAFCAARRRPPRRRVGCSDSSSFFPSVGFAGVDSAGTSGSAAAVDDRSSGAGIDSSGAGATQSSAAPTEPLGAAPSSSIGTSIAAAVAATDEACVGVSMDTSRECDGTGTPHAGSDARGAAGGGVLVGRFHPAKGLLLRSAGEWCSAADERASAEALTCASAALLRSDVARIEVRSRRASDDEALAVGEVPAPSEALMGVRGRSGGADSSSSIGAGSSGALSCTRNASR